MAKQKNNIITRILLLLTITLLCSCATKAPRYNYQELAQAALKLDMDIDLNDNHRLYIEASRWIGTPYRSGGHSKSGTDCSGLSYSICKTVYHKTLKRSSEEQRTRNCQKISKSKLNEGDLVFFHNGRNKRTANHVGIYLKNNRFIHASTSRGVIVSSLNEPYYRKCYMQCGRIK